MQHPGWGVGGGSRRQRQWRPQTQHNQTSLSSAADGTVASRNNMQASCIPSSNFMFKSDRQIISDSPICCPWVASGLTPLAVTGKTALYRDPRCALPSFLLLVHLLSLAFSLCCCARSRSCQICRVPG